MGRYSTGAGHLYECQTGSEGVQFLCYQRKMAAREEVKQLEDCTVANALGTWVFSVAGALLAIPVGIKRKSLGPLVFFGTTGTMLDIIMGINACEREHAEHQMKLLEEAQRSAAINPLADDATEH